MAQRLYRQSGKGEKFIHVACYNYLKAFDKWNPEPPKKRSEAPLEEAATNSERPEGRKQAKASAKRKRSTTSSDQDDFQTWMDQLKEVEMNSSIESDKRTEVIRNQMAQDRDLQLMMTDPSTIMQHNRRLWIEKKQAEILARDFPDVDAE